MISQLWNVIKTHINAKTPGQYIIVTGFVLLVLSLSQIMVLVSLGIFGFGFYKLIRQLMGKE